MGIDDCNYYGYWFFINLILARFTPFKYVFLTAHQTYYLIFVYLAVAVEVFANPNNTLVIIIGGLLTGIYCTLAPALAQPFLRKVTGSDDFAYGHTTTFRSYYGFISWKFI